MADTSTEKIIKVYNSDLPVTIMDVLPKMMVKQ